MLDFTVSRFRFSTHLQQLAMWSNRLIDRQSEPIGTQSSHGNKEASISLGEVALSRIRVVTDDSCYRITASTGHE